MKKIILFTGFIISLNITGQVNLAWAKQLGGPSSEIGVNITVDNNDNIITFGEFSGTSDFDPGAGTFNLTSNGLIDLYITKLDALGNFVWGKRIGGTSEDKAFGLCVDQNNNIYISGMFQGTADFDPGVGTFTMTSTGMDDAYICKLDPSGNLVWAKQFTDLQADLATEIRVDNLGNVYTCGSFYGTTDFDPGPSTFTIATLGGQDCFISKLDASGNFIWAKAIGANGFQQFHKLVLDVSNNIYLTGYVENTVDFDPGPGTYTLSANPNGDSFILKLNSSGNFIWAKTFIASAGGSRSAGYSIDLDVNNNVYSIGNFNGTVDFDPGVGTTTLISSGVNNTYISKLDASGNFVWVKKYAGTNTVCGEYIQLDRIGNVYTSGYFDGNIDFDPSITTFNLNTFGSVDSYITKLDNLGNFIWSKQIGGLGSDASLESYVDFSGSVYNVGQFSSTCDFDPSPSTFSLNTLGLTDSYVMKLSCNSPTNVTTGFNSTLCSNKTTTLIVTASSPVNWYSAPTSTVILGTGNSFITPTLSIGNYTFYAEATQTCLARTAITITVNPTPSITVNSGVICSGQSFTMVPSGASTYTYSSGSAVVTPSASSNYSVIGTSSLGCISSNTAVSSVIVNACTGINELIAISIAIYPNPNNGLFTIELNETSQVIITSVLGNVLFKSTLDAGKQTLEIKNYANGIYFVQLNQNGKQQTIKLIKE